MKAQITFKQLNPDYDKEFAKQYYHGEDSDGNRKENWSLGMGIEGNVTSLEKTEITVFEIAGSSVANVLHLNYKLESGLPVQFVVSNSLIDRVHEAQRQKYKTSHLYVYLKNTDDFVVVREANLFGYIALAELPAELEKYVVKSN